MRTHPKEIQLYHLPQLANLNSSIQMGPFDPAEFGNGSTVPDRHSFYSIFWFTTATGTHTIDFIPYDMRPNSVFFIRPGQTHYFDVDKDQLPEGFRLFMDHDLSIGSFDLKIHEFFQLSKTHPVLYLDDREALELKHLVDLLLSEFQQLTDNSSEALSHLVKLFLIKLDRFIKKRDTVENKASDGIEAQFQQLVEDHFFEQHRIKAYASQLGITADYLSERIKKELGISPSKLIHQRILSEAKRLLAYTDLTLTEIGQTLGFNDSAYFSRFFKREATVTPSHFRTSIREKYQNHPR